MSAYTSNTTNTQNELLLKNLLEFYKNRDNLIKMMRIINGESNISLRIVDWFVTNYSKKNYTVYELKVFEYDEPIRFKVYNDYKLKLKAYSKRRFDPFCRWERIQIPFDNEKFMETTIGQLNFFKWAIENDIIKYIETNYAEIENDMNSRNSTSKRKHGIKNPQNSSLDEKEVIDIHLDDSNHGVSLSSNNNNSKTRKKREELSVSACKCIKKETVKIVVKFN